MTGEYDGEPFSAAELEKEISRYFYHVTVKDETRMKRDVWALAEGEDTLTGAFMRIMRSKFEEAEADQSQKIEMAVKFGLAALSNREEPR